MGIFNHGLSRIGVRGCNTKAQRRGRAASPLTAFNGAQGTPPPTFGGVVQGDGEAGLRIAALKDHSLLNGTP